MIQLGFSVATKFSKYLRYDQNANNRQVVALVALIFPLAVQIIRFINLVSYYDSPTRKYLTEAKQSFAINYSLTNPVRRINVSYVCRSPFLGTMRLINPSNNSFAIGAIALFDLRRLVKGWFN